MRSTSRAGLLISMLALLAVGVVGCANQYGVDESLEKTLGIGSETTIVAKHQYGTGGFSSDPPTEQLVVTGSKVVAERSLVEGRLAGLGYQHAGDGWVLITHSSTSTVTVRALKPGDVIRLENRQQIKVSRPATFYDVYSSGS